MPGPTALIERGRSISNSIYQLSLGSDRVTNELDLDVRGTHSRLALYAHGRIK